MPAVRAGLADANRRGPLETRRMRKRACASRALFLTLTVPPAAASAARTRWNSSLNWAGPRPTRSSLLSAPAFGPLLSQVRQGATNNLHPARLKKPHPRSSLRYGCTPLMPKIVCRQEKTPAELVYFSLPNGRHTLEAERANPSFDGRRRCLRHSVATKHRSLTAFQRSARANFVRVPCRCGKSVLSGRREQGVFHGPISLGFVGVKSG